MYIGDNGALWRILTTFKSLNAKKHCGNVGQDPGSLYKEQKKQ